MLAVMLRDRVLAVISNEVADRFRPPGSCFRSRGLSRLRERHPVERPGPSTISPNTHPQQPISATNLTSVGMSAHAETPVGAELGAGARFLACNRQKSACASVLDQTRLRRKVC